MQKYQTIHNQSLDGTARSSAAFCKRFGAARQFKRWIAMVTLSAIDPHWLEGKGDPRDDQCAHGHVRLEVNGVIFVSPEDGEVTISAAGLFLLRTLENDHTDQKPVSESNLLFPCCGFTAWNCGKRFPVLVMGCPNGVDVELRHKNGLVELTQGDKTSTVPTREWKLAVHGFVKSIEEFYRSCPPRNPLKHSEDAEGWDSFWTEWKQRSEACSSAI